MWCFLLSQRTHNGNSEVCRYQNFLISSSKQDVNEIVFTASTKVSGINRETCYWTLVQKELAILNIFLI